MKLTQITHHDLDGYGAATVVRARAAVDRIIHVSRYSDVGPVVAAELARLGRAGAPERLLMTDLGLEAPAVAFIRDVVALNARRAPEKRHALVVLDHHASSLDQLAAGGFALGAGLPAWPALKAVETGDPQVAVLVDDTRSATRLAFDHGDLYEAGEAEPAVAEALAVLVEAVDAVDLWQKQRPLFRQGQALDEAFWDHVSGYVPLGHPWHDRFVGDLLLGLAARLGAGADPAAIEREAGAMRAAIVDAMLAGRPGDDATATTRMRLAPLLAEAPELFRRLAGGAKLSFGLDSGVFQRVSDAILTSRDAALVINVGRSGSLSFRSTDGSALDGARKFRGGGHRDAAGGRFAANAPTSLAEAAEQVSAVLSPPEPAPSSSPFAVLRDLKPRG